MDEHIRLMTHSDIQRLVNKERKNTKLIYSQVKILEKRLANCKRFYPFPGLIKSFEQDIQQLRTAMQ